MAIILNEGVKADLTTASDGLLAAQKAILHVLDTAVMDEYERSELNKIAWLAQSWHNELDGYVDDSEDTTMPPAVEGTPQ